jgi:hypothetical protein
VKRKRKNSRSYVFGTAPQSRDRAPSSKEGGTFADGVREPRDEDERRILAVDLVIDADAVEIHHAHVEPPCFSVSVRGVYRALTTAIVALSVVVAWATQETRATGIGETSKAISMRRNRSVLGLPALCGWRFPLI